jgi:peptidoglycan/LPS O-acetylase OafA/YrhL
VRPEIQALRAIAVTVVVVCHFFPGVLPGGFVGVDVFFVISGFLITSMLISEVDRTGRVALLEFWGRRARRILPAALFVLLVCAVATQLFVPKVHWEQFMAEIRWSALYAENWRLAETAVDYFARDEGPSPVQHYWSLAAEEQFYLVWPLLIGLAAAIHKRLIGVTFVIVTLVSLALSITMTNSDAAAAYFVTPTRAWEFAAGGLLALFRPFEGRSAIRAAVGWLGLAAIGVACVMFDVTTPFPGVAALLPVVGAVAVIWAGAPGTSWAATRGLGVRPVQYVGDISYSIYLWHWPLLILAPYAIRNGVSKGVLLVLILLLAAWTKRFIEDPIRHRRFLKSRPVGWTFAAAAACTAVVLATAAQADSELQREIRVAERKSNAVLAANPKCFGAASRDPAEKCVNAKLRMMVVPTPAEARKRRNFPCNLVEERGYLYICSYGVKPDKAEGTVALIGDSHAAHWRAAVDVVARQNKWFGYSLSHTGCPLSTTVHNSLKGKERTECLGWNKQVVAWLKRHPEIKTIMVSAISGGARDRSIDAVGGYVAAWKSLPASIERIVVIRDTPKVRGGTDDCVEQAIAAKKVAATACDVPRTEALARDPHVTAARRITGRQVQVVDMTPFICDKRTCYPVVGGALVYKDQNHLTEVFARTLGPYLAKEIDAG